MIFVHLPYFFEGGICMSEFRVFKNGDFTVMSNYHLKDKELSLKATGLLSKMLSLPEDWDYSLAGLVALTKDGQDSVKSTLNELKTRNYVEIVKYRTKKGTFQYNYLIFENPSIKALKMRNQPEGDFPPLVEPTLEEPKVEKPMQYNIKESNIKEFNINNKDIKDKKDIEHSIFTNELINLKYLSKEETKNCYVLDDFFENDLNNYSSGEIFIALEYIATLVVNKKFTDDEGKPIEDKVKYFKTSIKSNLENLRKRHRRNNDNEIENTEELENIWEDIYDDIKDYSFDERE